MTKDIELLPCPFCGGAHLSVMEDDMRDLRSATEAWVECETCEARSSVVKYLETTAATHKSAIAAWNRRSTDMESERPAPAAQVGGVVEAHANLVAAIDAFMPHAQVAFLWQNKGARAGEVEAYRAAYWKVKSTLSAIPTETGKGEDGGLSLANAATALESSLGSEGQGVNRYLRDDIEQAIRVMRAPPSPTIEEGEPVAQMLGEWDMEDDCLVWLEGCEKLQRGDFLYARPVPAVTDEMVEAARKAYMAKMDHLIRFPEMEVTPESDPIRAALTAALSSKEA